jgi:hypothetical protein
MAEAVGGPMANEYRAYTIGSDNHIFSRVDLICENDDDAKERVRQLVNGHPIELWRGATFLARFEPLQKGRPLN